MANRRISRARDLTRLLLFFLLIAAGAAYLGGLATEEISGRASVIDGDSLRLGAREIRLRGIDAPEYGQTCQNKQQLDFDCGERARQELTRLIGRRMVTCHSTQFDRFGRNLALCFTNGSAISVNEMMVHEGWAVDYGDFPVVEQLAREAERGLWSGRFEAPRTFRANRGDAVGQAWILNILGLGNNDD